MTYQKDNYLISILISLFLFACTAREANFQIKVEEHDYSLALKTTYLINQDSVKIDKIGYLKNEKVVKFFRKNLSKNERKKIDQFLRKFSFEDIKPFYENTSMAVEDGDIKDVFIKTGKDSLSTRFNNFYVAEFNNLFSILNSIFPRNQQIFYK